MSQLPPLTVSHLPPRQHIPLTHGTPFLPPTLLLANGLFFLQAHQGPVKREEIQPTSRSGRDDDFEEEISYFKLNRT
jgi:hypothetical protein